MTRITMCADICRGPAAAADYSRVLWFYILNRRALLLNNILNIILYILYCCVSGLFQMVIGQTRFTTRGNCNNCARAGWRGLSHELSGLYPPRVFFFFFFNVYQFMKMHLYFFFFRPDPLFDITSHILNVVH